MSYFHIAEENLPLAGSGCGSDCPCSTCRSPGLGLGERYVRAEVDREPMHPPPSRTPTGPSVPSEAEQTDGWFGEPVAARSAGPVVRVEAPAACPGYDRGEVEVSRTQKGQLTADVTINLADGRLLIADFGVNWRQVKESTKKEPLLQEWLQRFEDNDAYRLRLRGFSDCVGAENNNEHLRKGRVQNVLALFGPRARKRVLSAGAAPLGTFVSDNTTRQGRARNRSVDITFERQFEYGAQVITARCPIRTVKVWLNAFIPRDVKGLTKAIPDYIGRNLPRLAGKTYFETIAGCGLTDQRGFSSDIRASARMHSEAEIDLVTPRIVYQHHCTFPSVRLNCIVPIISCEERSGRDCSGFPSGSTSDMKFHDFKVVDNPSTRTQRNRTIYVKLSGSKGPGCLGPIEGRLAPKIDYSGVFGFELLKLNVLRVYFDGQVDQFPAYELYAVVNQSNPVPLFGVLPAPGSSPVTHLSSSAPMRFERQITLESCDGRQKATVFKTMH